MKKLIDVGAGVIDADYHGEVGVILFNFGEEDFVVNLGDKIAQLIFEKIKTSIVKETNELEGTDRGAVGYGSTGMKAVKNQNDAERKPTNIHASKVNETPLSQSRRLITVRQMSKIAKGDNPFS